MTNERLIEKARQELEWMRNGVPLTASTMKRLIDALEDAEKRAETEHYAKNRARNQRNEAREALAVFEKAHTPTTPTDDEREALRDLLGPILRLPISVIRDQIVASDVWRFRRSEVGHD